MQKSCVTPAGASTSLTSTINGVTIHTHTHSSVVITAVQIMYIVLYSIHAPVVQLVTLKPSDVGTLVRISVQSHELGFFLTLKKKKNAHQVENDYFLSTQNSTSRSTRERNG